MSKQIATYWDGLVRIRKHTGAHGLKLNKRRAVKIELWGAPEDHLKGCIYSAHPCWNEVWSDGVLIHEVKSRRPTWPEHNSLKGEIIDETVKGYYD